MTTMYFDPIGSMEFLLNGTTLNVDACSNVKVTTNEGQTFVVASICDNTEAETNPWGFRMTESEKPNICVTDSNGKGYNFNDLCYESQCVLTDYACEELF